MPIAHISLPVSSLSSSTAFYLAALKPLGYGVFLRLHSCVGFAGRYSAPDFWVHEVRCEDGKEGDELEGEESGEKRGEKRGEGGGMHVAFTATSKKAVKEFWEAALKAGATDNGPPGERPQYTKGYYAAYVLDRDGNNVECVFYQPWWLRVLQVAPSVVGAGVVAGFAWWVGRSGWEV